MNILNTNEETGKANWTYNENRYNRGGPGQQFDYAAYNARELAKAQQTGGILKTNAESGLENWQWGNQPKQAPPPKDYFEQYQKEQLGQAKKTSGGILKTNAESGAWNYASHEYKDPSTINRFNMEQQYQGNNTIPYQINQSNQNVKVEQKVENGPGGIVKTITTTTTTYNNNDNNNFKGPINSFSEIPKDVIERSNFESQVQNVKLNDGVYYNPKYNHPIIGEYTSSNYNPLRFGTGIPGQIKMINENVNFGISNVKNTSQTFVSDNNYNVGDNSDMNFNQSSNAGSPGHVGVQKIDTQESFVTEDGVKKKITKVTKYMDDGEIKTEIYKTTL